MAINKVIYGGNTLIDLTGDSVTKDKLLAGYTAHDKSGEVIEGTCLFDVDSTDATATAAEILNGQTAYARGNKVSGTMKNNGGRFRGDYRQRFGLYDSNRLSRRLRHGTA